MISAEASAPNVELSALPLQNNGRRGRARFGMEMPLRAAGFERIDGSSELLAQVVSAAISNDTGADDDEPDSSANLLLTSEDECILRVHDLALESLYLIANRTSGEIWPEGTVC
jgi:hypothetical protein